MYQVKAAPPAFSVLANKILQLFNLVNNHQVRAIHSVPVQTGPERVIYAEDFILIPLLI